MWMGFVHPLSCGSCFGFDDLRVFSQITNRSIPVYGNEPTIAELREVFGYVFRKTQKGGGKPQVETITVDGSFEVGGLPITPIPVFHGALPILGYRIGNMAYVTDCSFIPEESMKLLTDLELLILGVVRYEPHSTHMHVEQALNLVEELGPQQTYFTHISHLLEHEQVNAALPPMFNLPMMVYVFKSKLKFILVGCHSEMAVLHIL